MHVLHVGAVLRFTTSRVLDPHAEGRTLYVRPCNPDLYHRFSSGAAQPLVADPRVPGSGGGSGVRCATKNALIINGNPGVGTVSHPAVAAAIVHHARGLSPPDLSAFCGAVFFSRLCPVSAPERPAPGVGWTHIVLTSQSDKAVWLFRRDDERVLVFQENSMAYREYLDNSSAVYLIDAAAPLGASGPVHGLARTLVVSSPDLHHYRYWKRDHPSGHYMPPWSQAEVEAAYLDLMPPTIASTDPSTAVGDPRKDLAIRRFDRYGGIARSIFSQQLKRP